MQLSAETATITASAAGCNGPKTVNRSVTVTPTVGTPVFTAGATTVCQDAADETYTATATNTTGITYSASPAGAGVINSSTGVMNWNAAFTGAATITASAAGCNGPKTANRSVTVTPTVGTPVFTAGATTVCQDAANTTYTATATNTTGITYSASPAGAGVINSSTGVMDWDAAFSGAATITASAAGCNGPKTVNRSVTVTPTVGTPAFTAGATTVCQDAANETYTATATNTTGITYSVSPAGAGVINSSTGVMNWDAAFSGAATITASAAGCNGPKTVNRLVTVTPTVGTPVFTLGSTSARCQGAGTVTYGATATNTTGITYTLDPASITGGNTIVAGTGAVTYAAGWSGTTIITASAAGCNGPKTSTHTVSIGFPPTSGDITGTDVCDDGTHSSIRITINNGTPLFTLVIPEYAFSPVINYTSGTDIDLGVLSVGPHTYTLQSATDACGKPVPGLPKSVTINVNPLPAAITGTTTICIGSTTTLSNVTPGGTWSSESPLVATVNSVTGAVTGISVGTSVISYIITGTGCKTSATVTVTPDVGTPTFTAGAAIVCQDAANETYTATATNTTGITYSVSPAGAGVINSRYRSHGLGCSFQRSSHHHSQCRRM